MSFSTKEVIFMDYIAKMTTKKKVIWYFICTEMFTLLIINLNYTISVLAHPLWELFDAFQRNK